MRVAVLAGAVLAGIVGSLILVAVPAWAQTYPADLVITVPEVEVRSGPTEKFYPTMKLARGSKVKVLREADKAPGWLAVKPPPGSFSWIQDSSVQKRTGSFATVIGDQPVPLRPGSSLTNEPPNVESVMVQPGSIVVIDGKALTTPTGEVWLPIEPAPSEVRYIPAEAVKTSAAPAIGPANQTVSTTNSSPSAAATPLPAKTASVPMPAPYGGGWQPGGPTPSRSAASTTTNYSTAPSQNPLPLANPPQWSVHGVLRKAAFQQYGQPVYALVNSQGVPLLYATAQPGFSLCRYVGQTVRLYGSISYWSDEYVRTYFMTATHIALY